MPAKTNECECQIERILVLTRTARDRAQAGDWSAAVASEGERRPLIRDFFARPVPPQSRGRTASMIREILASDAGLIALAAAGRNEAANANRKLRQGRSATAAYAAAGTGRVKSLPPSGKMVPPTRPDSREVIDLP